MKKTLQLCAESPDGTAKYESAFSSCPTLYQASQASQVSNEANDSPLHRPASSKNSPVLYKGVLYCV